MTLVRLLRLVVHALLDTVGRDDIERLDGALRAAFERIAELEGAATRRRKRVAHAGIANTSPSN